MTDTRKLYALLANAFNAREWTTAREVALTLLPHTPDHGAAHYMAGVSLMELGQTAQALRHLRNATLLAPHQAHYVAQFAKALAITQQLHEAHQVADQALALAPHDPGSFNTLGQVYTTVHALQKATDAFQCAVALQQDSAPLHFNLGNALVASGKLDAAENEFETCIRLDPDYWDAYACRSLLRPWSSEDNNIIKLLDLAEKNVSNNHAQLQLHMAIAKEYEDTNCYSEAFAHYTIGKSAGGISRNYSGKTDEDLFSAIMKAIPTASAGTGFPTHEPIFIMGMPRTGTTLLDRIIGSHPDVFSAGELQNFGVIIKQVSTSKSRMMLDTDTISSLKGIDWHEVGKRYLHSTRPNTGKTRYFIDKLPHNFIYAGFILNALPNAKIICVRRDPIDTCLSNFRHIFAPNSPYYDYSYDLMDTGRYYVLFDRLISHWKRIFPGQIAEINYECMIENLEGTIRKTLSYCNLGWSDSCMRFDANPAPVATASAAQVRRPIYRAGLHRWKNYSSQLSELKNLLVAEGIQVDEHTKCTL